MGGWEQQWGPRALRWGGGTWGPGAPRPSETGKKSACEGGWGTAGLPCSARPLVGLSIQQVLKAWVIWGAFCRDGARDLDSLIEGCTIQVWQGWLSREAGSHSVR